MKDGSSKSKWIRPLILLDSGGILAFLGFVWPGVMWCLNTPGDTEMITLVTAGVVGIIGAVIFLFGVAISVSVILELRQQCDD